MGILLFIFLGVIILFISIAFFFIGRESGLRKAEKIANEAINIRAFDTLIEDKKLNCTPFISLSFYIILLVLLFFIDECLGVHNNIINKYKNGDYVQVEDTRSFVTADSTKFEKAYPVRYYTKKEFERLVKEGKLNKIEWFVFHILSLPLRKGWFFYIISCRCQTSDFFKEYNPAAASIQQVDKKSENKFGI